MEQISPHEIHEQVQIIISEKRSLEEVKQRLEQREAEVERLKGVNQTLDEQLSNCKAEHNAKVQTIGELNATVSSLEARKKELETEISTQKTQITQLEADKRDRENNIHEKERQILTLGAEKNRLEKENGRLCEQLKRRDTEIGIKETRITELEEERRNQENKINEKKRYISALEAEKDQLNNLLDKQSTQVKDLTTNLKALESDVEKTNEKIDCQTEIIAGQTVAIEGQTKEIERLRQRPIRWAAVSGLLGTVFGSVLAILFFGWLFTSDRIIVVLSPDPTSDAMRLGAFYHPKGAADAPKQMPVSLRPATETVQISPVQDDFYQYKILSQSLAIAAVVDVLVEERSHKKSLLVQRLNIPFSETSLPPLERNIFVHLWEKPPGNLTEEAEIILNNEPIGRTNQGYFEQVLSGEEDKSLQLLGVQSRQAILPSPATIPQNTSCIVSVGRIRETVLVPVQPPPRHYGTVLFIVPEKITELRFWDGGIKGEPLFKVALKAPRWDDPVRSAVAKIEKRQFLLLQVAELNTESKFSYAAYDRKLLLKQGNVKLSTEKNTTLEVEVIK
jgi:peptidoglycan hydrolase CwlO-like protein